MMTVTTSVIKCCITNHFKMLWMKLPTICYLTLFCVLTAWSSSWNSAGAHRTKMSSLHKVGSCCWHTQCHGHRCDMCSCIGPHIQRCPTLEANVLWFAILKFLKIFSFYLYSVSEGETMEHACAGVLGTWLMCSLTSHNLPITPGWLLG